VVALTVLLFTDIEGSTALWVRDSAAMKQALERHDELLGVSIRSAGGKIFKHTGDGCCATFPSVASALEAAALAQRRLAEESWGELGPLRVRMGVHVGEAEPRGEDWFGPSLSGCARMTSAGYGGQVLVSDAARASLGPGMAAELGFRHLGDHRLRDMARPEHVWQLTGPGLGVDFPPLRSVDSLRGSLPTPLTSFIGRDDERRHVRDLVASQRMVTLVGAGGMGKTRLALEVAAGVRARFPEGVWFVELASLADLVGLEHEVVATLGFRPQSGLTARQLLVGGLREWRTVLVLDNCEHLLDAVGSLVVELLNSCPLITILATSRAPLRVPAERVHQVGPLSLEHDAVALFLDRAEAARPDLRVGSASLEVVSAICRQLDGMPLAIELGAARLRSMTAAELLDRLGQRFRLLRAQETQPVGRHSTLSSLVDWSFQLLSAAEQNLLRDIGVFAGGFDLAAAHAVRLDSGADELDTFELLDGLVAQSLLHVAEMDGRTRYLMLETIRQYVVRSWDEDIDRRLRSRHADHFVRLAERANSELVGMEQVRWLRQLETDHDNMRAALRWDLREGDPAQALTLAAALSWFWRVHSHLAEGRYWLEEALAAAAARDVDPPSKAVLGVRSRAATGAGLLAFAQSEFDIARRLFGAALDFGRQADRPSEMGWALHGLGRVTLEEGDLPKASALLEQSISLFADSDDWRGLAYSTFFLGAVLSRGGDMAGAETCFAAAEPPLRSGGDLWGLAALAAFSAAPALARGDLPAAARRYGESLEMYAELNTGWMAAQALLGLAHTARLAERWDVTVRLYGAADALADASGIQGHGPHRQTEQHAFLMLGLRSGHNENLDVARQMLAPEAFDANWQDGRSSSLAQAIGLGIAASTDLANNPGVKHPRIDAFEALTRREQDVLRLVADGCSNKQIAHELSVSVRTVENHVAHIYAKLGVQSRVAAAFIGRHAEETSEGTE
jgi:predicted ATPase/class 3 adenylate cyclase/DNA-binding CsgD family transcriptional regulator